VNIQEAVRLREKLESDLQTKIQLRLNRFIEQTGLQVDSIDVLLMAVRERGNIKQYTAVSDVYVSVKI
jgi:hypothetical protein